MFVRNHMTREPVCLETAASLRDVVRVMALHGIRHIPIVNERRHVLGIISDYELRAAADGQGTGFWDLHAHDVMSHSPRTVEGDVSTWRVLARFCERGADALLVLERGALVGILTRTDLLRTLSNALALNHDGRVVEISLDDPADLLTAFEVLHRQKAEIKSAVAGAIRDDGHGAVLAVRIGTRHVRPVERALAQAGLILLVPEDEMLADNGVDLEP